MKKIYFDTEFEGLYANPGLISIGMTDDTGRQTFYAESADTFHPERCSAFCEAIVLPLLEGGRASMPNRQLHETLVAWLKAQGEDVVLICDSPRDIDQLAKLLSEGLPSNCSSRVIGTLARLKRGIWNTGGWLYKKHKLRAHHALDDAIANRIIFEGR